MMLELVLCSVLGANDWSQFRGPNSDGHAPNVASPIEWSDTKNVVWKASIPGLGWSSSAIVDGKVFVTTAVPRCDGLSLRAMSLDAQTGKNIWDREVRAVEQAPSIHTKNSHASPTSLVRDGGVFVHFGALGMARLAATDGAVQWTWAELEYPPMHGSGGSPVSHDGSCLTPSSTTLRCSSSCSGEWSAMPCIREVTQARKTIATF